jgi:hypothetical protein
MTNPNTPPQPRNPQGPYAPPVAYRSPPPQEDLITAMIPKKNVPALIGYYLGVFSIIPCIGFPLGVAAVVCGIIGLRKAARFPEAKGKAHAIVAIVCGGVFGLAWFIIMLITFLAAAAAPVRR